MPIHSFKDSATPNWSMVEHMLAENTEKLTWETRLQQLENQGNNTFILLHLHSKLQSIC